MSAVKDDKLSENIIDRKFRGVGIRCLGATSDGIIDAPYIQLDYGLDSPNLLFRSCSLDAVARFERFFPD